MSINSERYRKQTRSTTQWSRVNSPSQWLGLKKGACSLCKEARSHATYISTQTTSQRSKKPDKMRKNKADSEAVEAETNTTFQLARQP